MSEVVCPICRGEEWVCEDHPDKPRLGGCCGGAGMPCTCSPLHNSNLSSTPDGAGQQIPNDSMTRGTQSVRSPAPIPAWDASDKRWALIQAAEAAGEEFFMAARRIDGMLEASRTWPASGQ